MGLLVAAVQTAGCSRPTTRPDRGLLEGNFATVLIADLDPNRAFADFTDWTLTV